MSGRPRGRPRHLRIYLEGYEKAWKKADTLDKALPLLVTASLYSEAKRIMRRSLQLVPRASGALAASAYVQKPVMWPSGASVELGYRSDYAVRAHEMPRTGKTEGVGPAPRYQGYAPGSWAGTGQWKYLEQPFDELKESAPERMREELWLNIKALVARS